MQRQNAKAECKVRKKRQTAKVECRIQRQEAKGKPIFLQYIKKGHFGFKKVGGPMGKSGWAKMRAGWAEAHPAITLINAMARTRAKCCVVHLWA